MRFSNATIAGSGVFAVCNITLWSFYWLTQRESISYEIIAILLFELLPTFVFLYYISWRVIVLENRIIVYSWSAVYKSGLTKLRNKTAARMSAKVFAKGVGSSIVAGFYLDGYYGVKQHAYDRVKNLLSK